MSSGGRLNRFVNELKRRKVLNAAGTYLVMAFVAMQVVEAVFPYTALPDRAGTMVLIVLTIGFPIALVLAWTVELTLPGVRKELSREEAEALEAQKKLRADAVAVLPFENLSDDPENAYFSDGITDDIIASIAHVRGLRVMSRTAVMKYKGGDTPVSVVAGELGVATVVGGSVRKGGSRIRIVAEVVDARHDQVLWSGTYDRELEDIFLVQSEVAAQVAQAVQSELSPSDRKRIESRGTTDPEAYDIYLQGRFLWNQRSGSSVAASVDLFHQALEQDPKFALAHAALADAYTVLGIYGGSAPSEVFPAAKASADMALSLDQKLGEAGVVKACVSAVYDWDWEEAERGFLRAIEASPSYATAYQWYATNVLTPQGRFDDALAQLELARELDPASAAIAVSRAITLFYSRDYDSAGKEFEAVAKLHPRFSLAHYFLGQCHQVRGRSSGCLESLVRAVELSEESSETLAVYGNALAMEGRSTEAETLLSRLQKRSQERYVSPVLFAQILLGLGRTDEALDQLGAAADARSTDLIWIGVLPVYDSLRDDGRFRTIVERVGLA